MAHLVTHLHQLKELQRHVPQYIPVHVISLQDLANINTGTQVFNGKDCTMVENGVTKQNPNCTPGSSASGPVIRGATAFECTVDHIITHGSHDICIGNVTAITNAATPPLTYMDGSFQVVRPEGAY